MADDQPIIIIKRVKKGGHDTAHGGAWKVAFADFMTAMMAFFMVLWLVGQTPEVRESVAGFFRNPGKFKRQGAAGILKGSGTAIDFKNDSKEFAPPTKKKDYEPTKGEKGKMKSLASSIMAELNKQAAFKRLRKNVKIQMTSEGLRIILNESEDSPAFFEPGSAKLLQKSAIIMVVIARQLGQLSNHIVVEGHTDAGFTKRNGYSNWELSADRANAARSLMEVSGLFEGQVREVRGFADKFPMIGDKPTDQRNRRVTLVVLYEARERQYDELQIGEDLLAEI